MHSIAKQNIFLTGFMGVGKSTVGCKLSQELNLSFIDLDETIVELAGCSIPQIFDQLGEQAFRDFETKALSQLKQFESAVIATGGGVVGRAENRVLMKKLGRVIYLQADWINIKNRLINTSQRPLAVNNIDGKLHSLWQSRLPLYRQADIVVSTNNLSALQVVDKIIYELLLS